MDRELKRKFRAKVSSVEEVAKNVKKFALKIEEPFSYLPWQYIWLELINMKYPDPKGSRRAFSILNSKIYDNTIEIVARSGNSGYKKSLFSLVVGDEIYVHGPFGSSFIIEKNSSKNIIMIAGGVGIAAFLPMIETIRDLTLPIKSFLVYINSNVESTPFLPYLNKLKKETKGFDYKVKYEHFNYSDIKKIHQGFGDDSRLWVTGTQGFVDQIWSELEEPVANINKVEFENFYPTPKDVLTVSDIEKSITKDNIFYQSVESTTNHIVITDARGVILYCNRAAQKITGYTKEEILGNTPRLWGGLMSADFYREFWKNKMLGNGFEGELPNRRKNGDIYYVISHISAIHNGDGKLIGHIGTEEDITNLKDRERELETSNKFMVNRELEMIKLKEEIKKLKSKAN